MNLCFFSGEPRPSDPAILGILFSVRACFSDTCIMGTCLTEDLLDTLSN